MRIGIVTFWTSDDNYGQLLQCYALQRYLRLQGHDAFLIRYTPQSFFLVRGAKVYLKILLRWFVYYGIFYFVNRQRFKAYRVTCNERKLSLQNKKINKARNFDQFRNDYIISTSNIFTSIQDLRKNPPHADVYICGSDQIWGLPLKNKDIAGYFLDFGEKNISRISYATSFGRELSLDELKILKKYIRHFTSVSVRDYSAQSICRSCGRNDTVVTLDPTFLLPINAYQELMNKERINNIPYIFLYMINVFSKEEIHWKSIKEYIEEKQLGIRIVSSSGYCQARELIPEYSNNMPATIPEWMSYINDAQYIVTTSFHGVVFSIKMHKPFLVIPLNNLFSKGNVRITSLLSAIGLEDRILSSERSFAEQIENPIDWVKIDSITTNLQKESIEFIQSYCS